MQILAQNSKKEAIQEALGNFIQCSPGTFMMGSPTSEEGRSNDEKQHEVELSGFSMQSMEVTQRLWEMVMGSNPSDDRTWKDNPVTNVSYTMAQLFIQRLNELTGSCILCQPKHSGSMRLALALQKELYMREQIVSNKWDGLLRMPMVEYMWWGVAT